MTRLVILWLLSEGPLHGYRIKRILDDNSLRFWFPIETGSIYAVLRSLEKGGFIETELVERDGQRPERTRFRITKDGRAHFQALLQRAWGDSPRPSDPIDLALAARSELEEGEVERLLSARAESLRARLDDLSEHAASSPAPEIVDRMQILTQAELTWVEALLSKEREKRR